MNARILCLWLVGTLGSLVLLPPALAQDLPDDVREAIEEILAAARRDGLPVEDLELKAREGTAKGIAPERLLQAVRGRADSMRGLAESLKTELTAAGRPEPAGEARIRLVLALQRARDARLAAKDLQAVVRAGARAGGDPARLAAAVSLSGVAAGHGISSAAVVRIVQRSLDQGYSETDFLKIARRLLDLRERYGERYAALRIGEWLEEGIDRFPTGEGAMQYVDVRSYDQIPHGPPPPGAPPPSIPRTPGPY
jgi:hypothetical protein